MTSLNDGTLKRDQAAGARRRPPTAIPNPGLDDGRGRLRPEQAARSGAPRADLHHRSAAERPGNRRADQAHAVRLVDAQRHGFFRQALRTDAASRRGSRQGAQSGVVWITKGWLRASHRALDPAEVDRDGAVSQPHAIPSRSSREKSIASTSASSRWRIASRRAIASGSKIVYGDLAVTDVLWTHYYAPNKIGSDTIHHSAQHPVGADTAGDGRGVTLCYPSRPAGPGHPRLCSM